MKNPSTSNLDKVVTFTSSSAIQYFVNWLRIIILIHEKQHIINTWLAMDLLPFEEFIIPGIHFNSCTIWVLRWDTNPTPFDRMVEVWMLWHDGKKTCYISPSGADVVFKKYHEFDDIIPAEIYISETKLSIQIDVTVNRSPFCQWNYYV